MPRHIRIKLLETKNNERIAKAVYREKQLLCQGITLQKQRRHEGSGVIVFKHGKKRTFNPEVYTHQKQPSGLKVT